MPVASGRACGLRRTIGGADAGSQPSLRLGGRLSLFELGPGDLVERQAGLSGRGLLLVVEPELALTRGGLWAVVNPRLAGTLSQRRAGVPDALIYAGWPPPTGRAAAGDARRTDPGWRLDAPRAAAGLRLGGWALSAGLFPASVGPGLDGDGLTLTSQAVSLPQVVVRRTAAMRWSGALRSFAPAHVLVRAGWTSSQTLRYRTEWGRTEHRTTPVFSQWLVSWQHTPWWRTTVTHAALAAARRGESLWPDLLQVNFPLLSATWSETEYGPLTDRVFSIGMEIRFRDGPWPLLPRRAGRLWWEYGGEDYRPHDTLPLVPEISAPASLAGFELVDPRWDLGLQYLETRHPRVLWYSNSDYPRGYTHRDVLLGHPLGGAVAAWTAVIRVRSVAGGGQWELRARSASWQGVPGQTAPARRQEMTLKWSRRNRSQERWAVTVGAVCEEVGEHHGNWLTANLSRRF